MIKYVISFITAAVSVSCAMPSDFKNTFLNPAPRVSYERKLKREFPESAAWIAAHDNALVTPRIVKLPHGGKGLFKTAEFPVYSYRFELKPGEVLDAEVLTDSIGQQVFIDLYNADNISEPIASNPREANLLKFATENVSNYILTVQPEAGLAGNCIVLINKSPMYGFPVAGKGNSAIQSFWEAPRDGGKRTHEGIDIFAKKGTPVVAVTDGVISDSGDRGLGGKQVWQRTGLFGHSIYYAHLDEIAVASGASVKIGDTLGYVGNTGNAKGGPPHLHFGIYKGFGGAIDPLPFVYQTKKLTAEDFSEPKVNKTKKRTVAMGKPGK